MRDEAAREEWAVAQTQARTLLTGQKVKTVTLNIGQFENGRVSIEFESGAQLSIRCDDFSFLFGRGEHEGEDLAWLVKHGAWKRADDTRGNGEGGTA